MTQTQQAKIQDRQLRKVMYVLIVALKYALNFSPEIDRYMSVSINNQHYWTCTAGWVIFLNYSSIKLLS
jgi:hypothetical protein